MKSKFWFGKNVVVTGGNGFVGRHLVQYLRGFGADVFAVASRDYDLTRRGEVSHLFADRRGRGAIDAVFHLAATVGGIGANQRHPAKFLFENTAMNSFVAREAMNVGVKKFVALGSVCAYPKYCPVPFRESDMFNGYPEETNAPYGLTKRLLFVYLQAMRAQYGFNGIMLFPTNMFGPGDHFKSRDAHVIPMLIDRFIDAKISGAKAVRIWGTGQATRDFLYVSDAVRALEIAARIYDGCGAINLGTGNETKIIDLAETIAGHIGYTGDIKTDSSKPDGQPRRVLDITRARDLLNWAPRISLDDGLTDTIEWRLGND